MTPTRRANSPIRSCAESVATNIIIRTLNKHLTARLPAERRYPATVQARVPVHAFWTCILGAVGSRLAICLAFVVVLVGGSGSEASAVLGGRAISVQEAPWAVSLRASFGSGETFSCSGAILDPLHVLTAAHCLFNSSGFLDQLSRVTVTGGTSNFRRPWPHDHPQVRKAASIRFFPGYVWRPREGEPRSGRTSPSCASTGRSTSPVWICAPWLCRATTFGLPALTSSLPASVGNTQRTSRVVR